MKCKHVRLWVALGAVAVVFAASCSSSSSKSSSKSSSSASSTASSAASSGGGSAPGVTKDSINVAGIVSKPTFASAMQGAQARFDRENANGGVYGRKINI